MFLGCKDRCSPWCVWNFFTVLLRGNVFRVGHIPLNMLMCLSNEIIMFFLQIINGTEINADRKLKSVDVSLTHVTTLQTWLNIS